MSSLSTSRPVLVELYAPPVTAPLGSLNLGASLPGFTRDPDFEPVPMAAGPGGGPTVIIRGTVDAEAAVEDIEERPEVVRVWAETPVDHFGDPRPIPRFD